MLTGVAQFLLAPYRMWSTAQEELDSLSKGEAYDPHVAGELKRLHEEGRVLFARSPTGNLTNGPPWAEEVLAILKEHMPTEAWGFETVGDFRRNFGLKVEKLRKITMRYENLQ